MADVRMFVSQETLDQWLGNERVAVEGEIMTLLPERHRFRLTTAVHFLREVAEGGDKHGWVGKVKDLEQIAAVDGDHCAGSVVVGDDAYEVIEGFVGEPIHDEEDNAVAIGNSLAAATAAALGEGPPSGEIDQLTRFFLNTR